MLNQIFVGGSIRSGTTFVCNLFSDFVDEVRNDLIHLARIDSRLDLLDKNFAFKYCNDFRQVEQLKATFPKSKFVLVLRDMRDVVYSTATRNPKSIPFRDFPAVQYVADLHFISYFEASIKMIEISYEGIDECLQNHQDLVDEVVKYEDLLDPKKAKSLLDRFFPNSVLPLSHYEEKIKSTPNQKAFEKYTDEQKSLFKKSKLNTLLLKYGYVDTLDW